MYTICNANLNTLFVCFFTTKEQTYTKTQFNRQYSYREYVHIIGTKKTCTDKQGLPLNDKVFKIHKRNEEI